MKIERKTEIELEVGDLVVQRNTVSYTLPGAETPVYQQSTFCLAGKEFSYSPDTDKWVDGQGAEVTHEWIQARGHGRYQRTVVEAVARTWLLITWGPEKLPKQIQPTPVEIGTGDAQPSAA